MRAVRQLQDLRIRSKVRLVQLVDSVNASHTSHLREADTYVSKACIESVNIWTNFSRSLYLSCALRCTTNSGQKIAPETHSFASKADALLYAQQLVGRRGRGRNEPVWHDEANLRKLFQALRLQNMQSLSASQSTSSNCLKVLPTIRNFYAHRNEETANKAKRVLLRAGYTYTGHPTTTILQRLPGNPNIFMCELLLDLITKIELATD